MKTVNDRLKALERELEEAYHRWNELEDLAAEIQRRVGVTAGRPIN